MEVTESIWESAHKIGLSKSQVMIKVEILNRHPIMSFSQDAEAQRKYLEDMKKILETVTDNKYYIKDLGKNLTTTRGFTYFELGKVEEELERWL